MEVLQADAKFQRDIWNFGNSNRTEERATEMVNIWINTVIDFIPHKFFKICRTVGSKNCNVVSEIMYVDVIHMTTIGKATYMVVRLLHFT